MPRRPVSGDDPACRPAFATTAARRAESEEPPYSGVTMDEFWANAIWSLAPTVLIGLIFWFVMRAIIRADRAERKAYARIEAEERAKLGRERPAG
jgi:flagellar biosynthesis/type III secretory pathway M-ring protein FliF/YscJ